MACSSVLIPSPLLASTSSKHLKPEFILAVICAATPGIGQMVHLSCDWPRPPGSVEVEAGAVRAEDDPVCASDIAEGRSKEHDRACLPCFHAFKADPCAGVRKARYRHRRLERETEAISCSPSADRTNRCAPFRLLITKPPIMKENGKKCTLLSFGFS
jgi:hypothetical protein